jgi:DNA-binding transcriptional regulator LsrR (DeoR family)
MMPQAEIASRLGISRPYVSRLLKYAIDNKLIEIKVNLIYGGSRDIRLETLLLKKYKKVKKAFILKSSNKSFSKANFGYFTATNISDYIASAKVIGVSVGNAIEEMIKSLSKDLSFPDCKQLIQIMGSINNSNFVQPHILTSELGKKINSEVYFLNCPIFVEKKELRDMLMKDTAVSEVVKKWDEIDLIIAGIEDSRKESKLLPFLTAEDIQNIEKYEAVGDIAALYFDRNGSNIPIWDDRRIGISFDQMKKVSNKIVIGQGVEKASAIHAAIKNGLADVIVTDSLTFEAVCAVEEGQH